MNREHDLTDLICPLSKLKATQLVDELATGETARIILGDTDSLKSIAQELSARGIKPAFAQEGQSRFVLTVTK